MAPVSMVGAVFTTHRDMIMKGKVAKLADDLFVSGDTVEELYQNFKNVPRNSVSE